MFPERNPMSDGCKELLSKMRWSTKGVRKLFTCLLPVIVWFSCLENHLCQVEDQAFQCGHPLSYNVGHLGQERTVKKGRGAKREEEREERGGERRRERRERREEKRREERRRERAR